MWRVPGHWRDTGHRVSCGVLSSGWGKQTRYPSAVLPGMDPSGIPPQGEKLSWPRRSVTGNHFTVEISDWKPARSRNELFRCSPDVVMDCFCFWLFLSAKGTGEKLNSPSMQCIYHWEHHNGKFLVCSVQGRNSFGISHPFLNNMLMLMHKLINVSLIGGKPCLSWTLLKTLSSSVLLGETFSFSVNEEKMFYSHSLLLVATHKSFWIINRQLWPVL